MAEDKPETVKKVGMGINFNNTRRRGLRSFSRLTDKLNQNIENGELRINVEEIENLYDDVRMALICIAFSFNEGDPDFKDLSEEFPEDIPALNQQASATEEP